LKTLTLTQLIDYLVYASVIASFARIALNHLRAGLAIWISEGSRFWFFYAKVEATVAWLALSLDKFKKREAEKPVAGTLDEAIISLRETSKKDDSQ
jgi:hypothetical protein